MNVHWPRAVLGGAVLGLFAATCLFGAAWRACLMANRTLRELAGGTVAGRSNGMYQVRAPRVPLGEPHFAITPIELKAS